MLTAFLTTLEQMARIALFLVLGFSLNKLHILPKGAGAGISRLVTNILLPAMLLHSNMTEFQLADIGTYSRLVIMGFAMWIILTLVSFPICRKLSAGDRLERGIYLYGLSFPNSSAVGIPLALGLLGATGLFRFNLFLVTVVIMTYAWGVGLFMERKSSNPVKHFLLSMLNPIFISMMIGLLLGILGAKNWMPSILVSFVGDLGSCFVPMSLLMTGYSVADYPMGDIFRRPKSYVFCIMRLIILPLLALVLAKLFRATAEEAVFAALVFSGPSGMNVVVFPASYGRDCKTGASIVMLSSMGALITAPVIYALTRYFFGV